MVDLPWNVMSFVVGGKRYTAAYLDRPENPKEARYQRAHLRPLRVILRRRLRCEEAAPGGLPAVAPGGRGDEGRRRGAEHRLCDAADGGEVNRGTALEPGGVHLLRWQSRTYAGGTIMPLLDHFHPPLRADATGKGFTAGGPRPSRTPSTRACFPRGTSPSSRSTADNSSKSMWPRSRRTGTGTAATAADRPGYPGWAPPIALAPLPAVFPDVFEVASLSESGGPALVAALELVSPRNKDRPEARRTFAAKCAAYLQEGIGLAVMDVVTQRAARTCTTNWWTYSAPAKPSASRPTRPSTRSLITRFGGAGGTRSIGGPRASPSARRCRRIAARAAAGNFPIDLETAYMEARVSRAG